ncbi:MAG: DEAD/DEAH box helicase [Gemmatimonadaceae bacterium]
MLQHWSTLPDAVRDTLAKAHASMRRALDQEIAAQQEPPLPLPFGERLDTPEEPRHAYRFHVRSPKGFREGDEVEVRLADETYADGALSCAGKIIAAGHRGLTLSFSDDFGPSIPTGALLIPRGCVGYMEARKHLSRIEADGVPFNAAIAVRMIGEDRLSALIPGQIEAPSRLPEDLQTLVHLRLAQQTAIDDYIRLPFAALWGPPGTGKTFVLSLGVVLRAFHSVTGSAHGHTHRPRTLVLGPTNRAIDEAMARITTHMSDAMSVQRVPVIRYGRNVTPQLVARFGEQIVYNRVVQRVRGARMRRAVDVAARLETQLDELDQVTELLSSVPPELDDVREGLIRDRHQLARYIRRCQLLSDVHARRFDDARHREFAVARDVMDRTQVVGTTVHQALMSARIRDAAWDTVVIDEASQVPFAMAYAVAVAARETAWVVGDPRQLGPVVAAQGAAAQAWMARDVFTVSGSVADERRDRITTAPWVSRLDLQHRMHPEICEVVNEAYGGTLQTSPEVEAERTNMGVRLPLAHAQGARGVYLVDTTALHPTVRRAPGGSRTNRTHVAVVRALTEFLDAQGVLGAAGSTAPGIAIISPFVAQARWTARVIRDRFSGRPIRVDTVHAFQGQEVDTVIFDLTESPGLELTEWMYARSWSDDGGRLLTVGCSRARRRLFVVANAAWMYERLQGRSPQSVVYRLLQNLERSGGAIDVERDIREFAMRQRHALPARPHGLPPKVG